MSTINSTSIISTATANPVADFFQFINTAGLSFPVLLSQTKTESFTPALQKVIKSQVAQHGSTAGSKDMVVSMINQTFVVPLPAPGLVDQPGQRDSASLLSLAQIYCDKASQILLILSRMGLVTANSTSLPQPAMQYIFARSNSHVSTATGGGMMSSVFTWKGFMDGGINAIPDNSGKLVNIQRWVSLSSNQPALSLADTRTLIKVLIWYTRKAVVDLLLNASTMYAWSEYPDEMQTCLISSVGSLTLASDYDLSVAGRRQSGLILVKFNNLVNSSFRQSSGKVFDTNLYASTFIERHVSALPAYATQPNVSYLSNETLYKEVTGVVANTNTSISAWCLNTTASTYFYTHQNIWCLLQLVNAIQTYSDNICLDGYVDSDLLTLLQELQDKFYKSDDYLYPSLVHQLNKELDRIWVSNVSNATVAELDTSNVSTNVDPVTDYTDFVTIMNARAPESLFTVGAILQVVGNEQVFRGTSKAVIQMAPALHYHSFIENVALCIHHLRYKDKHQEKQTKYMERAMTAWPGASQQFDPNSNVYQFFAGMCISNKTTAQRVAYLRYAIVSLANEAEAGVRTNNTNRLSQSAEVMRININAENRPVLSLVTVLEGLEPDYAALRELRHLVFNRLPQLVANQDGRRVSVAMTQQTQESLAHKFSRLATKTSSTSNTSNDGILNPAVRRPST